MSSLQGTMYSKVNLFPFIEQLFLAWSTVLQTFDLEHTNCCLYGSVHLFSEINIAVSSVFVFDVIFWCEIQKVLDKRLSAVQNTSTMYYSQRSSVWNVLFFSGKTNADSKAHLTDTLLFLRPLRVQSGNVLLITKWSVLQCMYTCVMVFCILHTANVASTIVAITITHFSLFQCDLRPHSKGVAPSPRRGSLLLLSAALRSVPVQPVTIPESPLYSFQPGGGSQVPGAHCGKLRGGRVQWSWSLVKTFLCCLSQLSGDLFQCRNQRKTILKFNVALS